MDVEENEVGHSRRTSSDEHIGERRARSKGKGAVDVRVMVESARVNVGLAVMLIIFLTVAADQQHAKATHEFISDVIDTSVLLPRGAHGAVSLSSRILTGCRRPRTVPSQRT